MRRVLLQERGSMLIESVVATAILAVALIPLWSSFAMSSQGAGQAGSTMAALNIARGCLEPYHADSGTQWDNLPDGIDPTSCYTGGVYTVTKTVHPHQGSTYLKDIWVTVSWTDPLGRGHSVTLSTSVSRRP